MAIVVDTGKSAHTSCTDYVTRRKSTVVWLAVDARGIERNSPGLA